MREASSLCVNNMNLSIRDMKGGLFVLLIENNNLRRSLNSKPLPHLTFRPMPMFAGLQRRQTMDCSFFNNECNLMWPTLNIYIYIANSRYVYICIYIRIQHTNISSLYPHLHFAPQYVWSVYYLHLKPDFPTHFCFYMYLHLPRLHLYVTASLCIWITKIPKYIHMYILNTARAGWVFIHTIRNTYKAKMTVMMMI